MKFKDFVYDRIDFDQVITEANQIIQTIQQAPDFTVQSKSIVRFNDLIKHVQSMATLASIRHTIDTNDPYYQAEEEFYDRNMPDFDQIVMKYQQTLLQSRFREEIIQRWGKQILDVAQVSLRAISDQIVEESKEENLLTSRYQQMLAGSLITFRGEQFNLPGIMKFLQNPDRTVRKAAFEALSGFFWEKETEFDQLFDQLVSIRTKMAKKMGYADFIELGYARMRRTDYTEQQIINLRRQVIEWIVPLCMSLRESQRKRISVDTLFFYDQTYQYPDGNPLPKGDEPALIEKAWQMYHEMSNETAEFFTFMKDHELMDLTSRKGKAMGGYCTYLPDFEAPFIFSNFNGTAGDVDVLTHEAGHALQTYLSREFAIYDYGNPSYETAEIHSMTMEYFAYPFMESFFGEDADKYRESHLVEALQFIPYGICVDHFQHEIYRDPQMSCEQRRTLWRNLEKQYMPYINYDGNEEMEKGVYWYRQAHIFMHPFYYIDYVIASLHALQYYVWMKKDIKQAWDSYIKLCRLGGSLSYLDLIREAGLDNIFEHVALKEIIDTIANDLPQWS